MLFLQKLVFTDLPGPPTRPSRGQSRCRWSLDLCLVVVAVLLIVAPLLVQWKLTTTNLVAVVVVVVVVVAG
jgi:hypothetical protein